jgi:hypothetical protein
MSPKTSFLTLLTLTTTIACSDKNLEANASGEGSEPNQEDTGSDNSGDDADEGSDDTGEGSDDTGEGSDDTGEGSDDTGEGSDDTGTVEDVQVPPTPEAFNDLTLSARDDQTQVFDVLASDWSFIDGEQGSSLMFQPNSFSSTDGDPVTGEVQIQFIEIFDKGSMLVTDMPSIGQLPSGDVAQLISGGEHYVGATQDGEALTMNSSFELTAPAENTGDVDWGMGLFRAEVSDGVPAELDDQAVWIEQAAGAEDADVDGEGDAFGINRGEGPDGAGTNYWMLSGQFGWTNIDRWYSDPRPKTTINVAVPEGWDDSNSAVYLSYDGEPTALARMDTFDEATGYFSEHYGLLPIGLEVHLIFVTESEGDWSYAIQGATIVDGHLSSFASAEDLIETDTEGLVNVINALP